MFFNAEIPSFSNEDILLRTPKMSDFSQWQQVRIKNKNYLTPFEPRWHDIDLTKQSFKQRLKRQKKSMQEKTEFVFFIFLKQQSVQKLVGSISLSNIRYRAAYHVNIGYWMSEENSNKGIMSKSLALLLPFIFEDLKLQRANAACLIHNIASRKLLEKNGFEEEGLAKKYLQIDCQWRDHVLYGLTKESYLQRKFLNNQENYPLEI